MGIYTSKSKSLRMQLMTCLGEWDLFSTSLKLRFLHRASRISNERDLCLEFVKLSNPSKEDGGRFHTIAQTSLASEQLKRLCSKSFQSSQHKEHLEASNMPLCCISSGVNRPLLKHFHLWTTTLLGTLDFQSHFAQIFLLLLHVIRFQASHILTEVFPFISNLSLPELGGGSLCKQFRHVCLLEKKFLYFWSLITSLTLQNLLLPDARCASEPTSSDKNLPPTQGSS